MSQANDWRQLLKEECAKSILLFAKTYFSQYMPVKSCAFHKELCDYLMEISETRGKRFACAAPRGHAKSTIVSLFYVIWSMCYGKEKFIAIISETSTQAQKLLDDIKYVMESTSQLKEDFPELFIEKENSGVSRSTQSEIITANDIIVMAIGSEQERRGIKHRQYRPTLIILDDIDGEKNTYSEATRRKLFEDFFSRMVLNAGSKITNIVVIGTIIHPDSLLGRLTREQEFPNWKKTIRRAVIHSADNRNLWEEWNEILYHRNQYKEISGEDGAEAFFNDNKDLMLKGSSVLWPEVEDYYALMKIRFIDGMRSFTSEKQNEPVNEEDCRFDPEKFKYWDSTYADAKELLDSFNGDYVLVGACDPSVGLSKKKSDYSAIIILAVHQDKLYVIDADISRRPQEELADKIIDFCKMRRPLKFVIEENLFRGLLVKFIRDRADQQRVMVPLAEAYNTRNKELRIIGIETYVTSGIIVFARKHYELLEQLKYFPRGEYDDGPDALAMAVSTVELTPEIGFVDLTGKGGAGDSQGIQRKIKPITDKWGRPIDHIDFGLPPPEDDTKDDDEENNPFVDLNK